ncbi:gamma-glutamyl-gamma-aminobutyrate hydrolase family protein [Candidatus Lariskella endosymbiont of Hedychridium roseum]|uniref:gamma-glutamyl-gamma-aminobutyrate hydrolase family protein n=1 Tax=Candidatus Lariskella endosymbiont of Hedychridium roseum TaxID=3077949 RepID=UPI0030CE9923
MLKRPLVGITVDSCKGDQNAYSNYSYYALREFYSNAVVECGAIPLIIPYDITAAGEYSTLLDGLVITGGNFDIDPKYYNQNVTSNRVTINERRTAFEYAILKEMLARKKSIFGICGGHQLINVFFGGTLIQHIPDSVKNCIEHEQKTPKHLTSHGVNVASNTILSNILGTDAFKVNSSHHQAVDKLGAGLIASAFAEDSVIEAIEHVEHKFCVGVQWHPEFLTTGEDRKLFTAFISSCV